MVSSGFDLHSRAPDANWVGSAGTITFGGPDTDTNGFAMYRNNQKLEDGSSPAKVLEIYPQMVTDGVMTGLYPAYTVVSGEHFKAKIGFLALSDGTCGAGNVKFQLNYKESGVLKPLGEWSDTCDGVLKDVDVDLSSIVREIRPICAGGPGKRSCHTRLSHLGQPKGGNTLIKWRAPDSSRALFIKRYNNLVDSLNQTSQKGSVMFDLRIYKIFALLISFVLLASACGTSQQSAIATSVAQTVQAGESLTEIAQVAPTTAQTSPDQALKPH